MDRGKWRKTLVLALTGLMASAGFSFTEACWIWAAPRENPPTNVFLRVRLDVTKEVRKAWFFCLMERSRGVWLNGRPLSLGAYPENRELRGHVRSQGRDITSLLAPGENVLLFERCRGARGCYGLLLRGAVEYADGTRRDFCSSAKDFEGAVSRDGPWTPAWEQGDATMVPWSRYGEPVRQFATEKELADYLSFMHDGNGAFPAEALAKEPESPNARIVYSGLLPAIETNGKVLPPYRSTECEFTPDPASEAFIRQCAKIGLHLYSLPRFRSNQMSTSQTSWDFRPMDDAMRRILQLDPEARFSLYAITGRHLPDGWLDAHPDELCAYAVKSSSRHEYGGNVRTVSFASEAYRAHERSFWRAFGDFARGKPWRRRLVMVHCGFGGSGDGMPCGCHTMPDVGKRMTERFRAFLKARYGTDAALRRAWADETVTLDAARVPDAAERWGSGKFVKDPSDPRDVRVLDYYDCYHSVFEEFVLDFGKSVKDALPGTLVGAYHGYVILGYTPEGSTAKFDRILRSPHIDYFYATTRGYNLVDGLFRDLVNPLRRAGKLASIEGYDLYSPDDFASAPKPYKAVFRLRFEGEPAPKTAADWARELGAKGCHAYTRPGFFVRENSRLLLVFVPKGATVPGESKGVRDMLDQSGVCDVTLRRACRAATDVLTGEVVARDADRLTLRSDGPRLWLLEIDE